jgi:hypothetical protein
MCSLSLGARVTPINNSLFLFDITIPTAPTRRRRRRRRRRRKEFYSGANAVNEEDPETPINNSLFLFDITIPTAPTMPPQPYYVYI